MLQTFGQPVYNSFDHVKKKFHEENRITGGIWFKYFSCSHLVFKERLSEIKQKT